MKNIQKISFLTAILILLGVMVSVPVYAEDSAPATDLNAENLVVWYDFEGATLEEQLKDKATGGVSKEDLSFFTSKNESGEDMSYISDGIAHIDRAGGNYMICEFDAEAGIGKDITDCGGEMTVFGILKMSGNPDSFVDFFDVGNVCRIFGNKSSDGGVSSSISSRLTSNAYNSNTYHHGWRSSTCYLGYDVFAVAMTLKYDSATGALDVTSYISFDNGKTFSETTSSFANVETFYTDSEHICIVKTPYYSIINRDRGGTFDVDEFRVYNKVLTRDEIAALSSTNAFVNDTENNTGEESSDGTVTTNAPVQTTAPTDNQQMTNAPATDSSPVSQNEDVEKKKGCSSTVVSGGALISAFLFLSGLMLRKKED